MDPHVERLPVVLLEPFKELFVRFFNNPVPSLPLN